MSETKRTHGAVVADSSRKGDPALGGPTGSRGRDLHYTAAARGLAEECTECARLRKRGRSDRDPIHCTRCHLTWTGVEAQHCVRCHHTFASISAADDHRHGRTCVDPATTEGWHQKRPNVWTFGTYDWGA